MKKEDKIRILQEVVKIPSVNGNEEKVADYLQELLQKAGISSEKIMVSEGRANLVAEIGDGKGRVLALSGHMDVVDAGDEAQWEYPPFSATIEGDKLYGRGSTDMKAGTVAFALAMIELVEEKYVPAGTVRYLATAGEEIGEVGAEVLTQKGYLDDVDALIIGEPSNYILANTHKGSINYTVTAKGKTAHSSMPEEGINAINPLIEFSVKATEGLKQFIDSYENEQLGRLVHNITVIQGGDQVNSIPGNASLQGNIRTIPETPNEQVIEALKQITEEINRICAGEITISIDYDKTPVDSDAGSELIRVVKSVTKKLVNKELEVIGMPATTDASEFTKSKKQFDFVVYGPGENNLPHQINEYVSIQNYLEMIDIYKEIIKEYLKPAQ